MKLVALARAPADREAAARAVASATGLTLAEARMRLAPEPPALVARLEAQAADALVAAPRKDGLAALAVALPVPSDADRLPVRSVTLGPEGVAFTARTGDALEVRWPEILAVLRGLRASRRDAERTEKTRKLSLTGMAATGGLPLTRTTSQTVRSSEESVEQVVLVYVRDGGAVTIAEREVDFSCLGPGMQPSSTGNMVEIARRLRERAPAAFHDDRLLRLGRRPLPFIAPSESRAQTRTIVETRTDTAGSLDALAEVMRRGIVEGVLP
ncbi:MAG: hypothetical protein ACJ79R_06715 [Anaeromyxobacteraceae bacterium]